MVVGPADPFSLHFSRLLKIAEDGPERTPQPNPKIPSDWIQGPLALHGKRNESKAARLFLQRPS